MWLPFKDGFTGLRDNVRIPYLMNTNWFMLYEINECSGVMMLINILKKCREF